MNDEVCICIKRIMFMLIIYLQKMFTSNKWRKVELFWRTSFCGRNV